MNEKDNQSMTKARKITAMRELVNHHVKSCNTAGMNKDALIRAPITLKPDPSSAMYYTADDLCSMEEKDSELSIMNLEDQMIDEFEELGFKDSGTLYEIDDDPEFLSCYQDAVRK